MRYVIAFILSFFSFFTLQYFDITNVFTIGLVFLLILAIVFLPVLHTVLFETNMDKIERFLLKNKKNPNFYMIYALANEIDDEVKDITEKLVKKSKQESRQAMYKVVQALYFKDVAEAKLHINQIKPVHYRLYYQASILLEEGDLDGAVELMEKLPSQWMKDAILAEHAKKLNNLATAKDYANKAMLHSKGLQRYLLHKTYEREFGT
ncbi:hypothetical protein [Bacillus sp. PS06]|uniref:hypothetical protein n=1 Tax=Bacillus sp. PS06 TaxID=2764176 RepID=UPI00178001D3|nr:hypothetical protein [Bacillus sp. PS06]MBD8068789.1 hypothetical protein [Bacillus sp. PS06]